MRIISWNIAGIKRRKLEIEELVQKYQPDILCLQKTRSKDAPSIDGYNCLCDCADQWSGVATYCRDGLSYSFMESDSHHLVMEFESFVLINAYVPYSNKSVPGFIERRKEWDKWIVNFVKNQLKPVIMCGDLNIVHTALDTFQAKYEQNTGCYYAWERDDFNRLLEEGNMFDSFRFKHPYKQGYTYFDTMHGANYRALNQGTRLDYFIISERLKPYLVKSDILSGFGSAPSVPILLDINYPERVYAESDPIKQLKESLDRFTRQYLQNDIDNFLNFNLVELKGDKEFGCPGRFFDPDDTNIMRIVYVLLFSDVWPNLNLESLSSGDYRGDTLNTYNTMFGQPDIPHGILHPGLSPFNPSQELLIKVSRFHRQFTTIGNMIVLPNKRVDGKTINTYRGCHPQWRDFFDRFIAEFKQVLNDSCDDDGLNELIAANSEAFTPFLVAGGFNAMATGLLLDDYLDANGNPEISSKGLYFWKKNMTREEYLEEAMRYVDFASSIISNRGKRMIAMLKSKLNY